MLRSLKDLERYRVSATDGDLGSVVNFLLDDEHPRYIQRRRGLRAVTPGKSPGFDHSAWGRGGDLVWMVFAIGMIWVVAATWWR
jgi:hypothetical protein